MECADVCQSKYLTGAPSCVHWGMIGHASVLLAVVTVWWLFRRLRECHFQAKQMTITCCIHSSMGLMGCNIVRGCCRSIKLWKRLWIQDVYSVVLGLKLSVHPHMFVLVHLHVFTWWWVWSCKTVSRHSKKDKGRFAMVHGLCVFFSKPVCVRLEEYHYQ